MNEEMKFTGYGAYLYGALYLASVFALGIATGNTAASYWAVAAMGAAYLSQIVTAFRIAGAVGTGVSMLAWIAAGLVGAIAGLVLLIGG